MTDWTALERAARTEALAVLEIVEASPLATGQLIAWAQCRFGRTDGFSAVHRVENGVATLCGEVVPAPILRVVLTPSLARTLGRCKWCEKMYTEKGVAA